MYSKNSIAAFTATFLLSVGMYFALEDIVISLSFFITVTLSKAMSITADFGEKKEVKVDVNKDGSFTVADLVMLEKFLLGAGTLTDWQAGDLYNDGKIDVFDMIKMREKIISY